MSFESGQSFEQDKSKIEIEPGFSNFLPKDFIEDPLKYFEEHGVNIKSGEVQYDDDGLIKEDPTAVKLLPSWFSDEGEELKTVAKKVNTIKSQVGKTGDPFYEYKIMEIAQEFGLPAPKPIVKVEQDGSHIIVMEKVEGITWTDNGMKAIHGSDLTEADKQNLLTQAKNIMLNIEKKFEDIGLHRNWKLKDMVFNVDIPNRRVIDVIPTDWERTKIDIKKLELARQQKQ